MSNGRLWRLVNAGIDANSLIHTQHTVAVYNARRQRRNSGINAVTHERIPWRADGMHRHSVNFRIYPAGVWLKHAAAFGQNIGASCLKLISYVGLGN